ESTAKKAITSGLSERVNLSDSGVHTVVINYDPGGECSGTLKIYVDSSDMPVLTASVNLSCLLSLGNESADTAFVGFTCATGSVENNDILNWSFSAHEGNTTNVILTFTPGNPSQVAKFGCASSNDCTNAGAHSAKFSLKQVNTPFTIVVSATRVDGNG